MIAQIEPLDRLFTLHRVGTHFPVAVHLHSHIDTFCGECDGRRTCIDDLQSTSASVTLETSCGNISRVHMNRFEFLRTDDMQERSAQDFPIADPIPLGGITFLPHRYGVSGDIRP
jgi:hypothetical protein